MLVLDALDTRGNPFYEDAEIALWTADRDGRSVGRIAAIENGAHNRTHDDRVGFFGFFECENDTETADALFAAASLWLSQRGLDRIRGPVSPSMNHECGLLVESFDDPPKVMTPWNPSYYEDLVESHGFTGVMDLLSFWIPSSYWVPGGSGPRSVASHQRIVRRLKERRKGRMTCRPFDLSRFDEELEIARTLLNEAWEGNWGFVPFGEGEFRHISTMFRYLAMFDLTLFAEVDGEVVAFILVFPDLNEVFRSVPSGRLSPSSVWKILRAPKTAKAVRVVLMGTRHGHRNRGVFSFLLQELADRGVALGLRGAEGSWVLADNKALVEPLAAVGPPTRRWRMFEKSLEPDTAQATR